MTEQQLLSLLDNVVSLAILMYFAMYFKTRAESVTDKYIEHLEGHSDNEELPKKEQ